MKPKNNLRDSLLIQISGAYITGLPQNFIYVGGKRWQDRQSRE